jgi:hypothetical protein
LLELKSHFATDNVPTAQLPLTGAKVNAEPFCPLTNRPSTLAVPVPDKVPFDWSVSVKGDDPFLNAIVTPLDVLAT